MITNFKEFEGTNFHSIKQIDDIIDKISSTGYNSLDDSEKAILNNFSKNDEDINLILVELSELELKLKILQKKMRNEIFDDLKQKQMEHWIKITSKITSLKHQLEHIYKVDNKDVWAFQDKNGLLTGNEDDYGYDENESILFSDIEKQEVIDFIIGELKNDFKVKNYKNLNILLNKISHSFLLHELPEDDWELYKNFSKEKIQKRILSDLILDHEKGDYTILDELLNSKSILSLIKLINKDKWELYFLNKKAKKYNIL